MTIMQIFGWLVLCGGLLIVTLDLTVFRRWTRWARFLKHLGRFAITMAVFTGGIIIVSTLASILPIYSEYLSEAQLPLVYVAIVGESISWARLGIVLAVVAILLASASFGSNFSDWFIPQADSNKQLAKEQTEWMNSKLPKWLRTKAPTQSKCLE